MHVRSFFVCLFVNAGQPWEETLLRLFRHLSEKNRGACKLSWVC
jgi:hypothetical protein